MLWLYLVLAMIEEVTETKDYLKMHIMKGQSGEVVPIDDLAMTGEKLFKER